MNTRGVVMVLSCAAVAGCTASDEERRSLLESAQRVNYEITQGTVVRDTRSPADSGRNIYYPPIHLSQGTASRAGARQVWAPFGISQPDTIAPTPPR